MKLLLFLTLITTAISSTCREKFSMINGITINKEINHGTCYNKCVCNKYLVLDNKLIAQNEFCNDRRIISYKFGKYLFNTTSLCYVFIDNNQIIYFSNNQSIITTNLSLHDSNRTYNFPIEFTLRINKFLILIPMGIALFCVLLFYNLVNQSKPIRQRSRLIVDSGEQSILQSLTDSGTNYVIKTLQVGNYQIWRGGVNIECHMCIERKTWLEYLQAISGNLIQNMQKMIKLRKHTNCKLYILLEGVGYNLTEKERSCVESSLKFFQDTHGIEIIRTLNTDDSVDTLIELLGNKSENIIPKREIDLTIPEWVGGNYLYNTRNQRVFMF